LVIGQQGMSGSQRGVRVCTRSVLQGAELVFSQHFPACETLGQRKSIKHKLLNLKKSAFINLQQNIK